MDLNKKQKSKFSDSYIKYYPIVFSTIYSKIGDIDTTEELTHEVFLQYLSDMDKVQNVRAWLLSIIKGFIYNHYKNAGKMSEQVAYSEVYDDINLKYVNGFRDTRIIINEAIEILDDETDRIIFDLVAIQKFTFENAGKQLGLSRYNLRYRYRIIVKKILDFLHSKGIKNIEDLL